MAGNFDDTIEQIFQCLKERNKTTTSGLGLSKTFLYTKLIPNSVKEQTIINYNQESINSALNIMQEDGFLRLDTNPYPRQEANQIIRLLSNGWHKCNTYEDWKKGQALKSRELKEMEKIDHELILLRLNVKDYPATKKRAKYALYVAIGSLTLSLILGLLLYREQVCRLWRYLF